MAGERAWAQAPIGVLEQCDHLNISWLTECKTVFLWALGLCELPADSGPAGGVVPATADAASTARPSPSPSASPASRTITKFGLNLFCT
jgi:hypothetical protein